MSKVSSSLGDMAAVRSRFVSNGSLPSAWEWNPGSVVAFSHADVDYLNSPRAGYWRSAATDTSMACVRALLDLQSADAEGRNLDAQIASKAYGVGGSNYSDIATLSVRQVFGAFDITIPEDTLDTSDAMVFVKEISSNGNVNTMDVIMPISPILYVLAPEYIRLLLEPVMQYLATGAWPHNYTVHVYSRTAKKPHTNSMSRSTIWERTIQMLLDITKESRKPCLWKKAATSSYWQHRMGVQLRFALQAICRLLGGERAVPDAAAVFRRWWRSCL
jgi:hypothetical protein